MASQHHHQEETGGDKRHQDGDQRPMVPLHRPMPLAVGGLGRCVQPGRHPCQLRPRLAQRGQQCRHRGGIVRAAQIGIGPRDRGAEVLRQWLQRHAVAEGPAERVAVQEVKTLGRDVEPALQFVPLRLCAVGGDGLRGGPQVVEIANGLVQDQGGGKGAGVIREVDMA